MSASARPEVATRDDRDPAAVAAMPIDLDDLADLLADVLVAEGAPPHATASLQLVSSGRMAELNAEHLGGDGPTDVLSFPIDGVDVDEHHGGSIVGDVVVCPEVAAGQAPGHAGDLTSELSLLVVHGGLHLCGWDHADDVDRQRMWAREEHLLDLLDRPPARRPWADR